MKWDKDTEKYILETTGRKFYSNCGIIGIDRHGSISEGYDGSIDIELRPEWEQTDHPHPAWTKEERQELANEMIQRWQQFANASA